MASLLKFIVPIVFISSVSLANSPKSEVPRRERADMNEIYKKAFESAREAHNKQVGLRQSGKVNSRPLSLSSTEAITVKAESWYSALKASITIKWNSFWRGTKRTVAKITGTKGDAPETTGLFIEQTTNGPRPVYYIGFDEIIGDVDHMVWDFGDGTGFTMPYSDFSEDLYGITHTFATDGLHTVSVSLYNSEGDFTTATIDVNSTGNQLPYSRFSIRSAGGNAVRFNVGTIDEDRTQPSGSGALYSMKFGDGARYDDAEPTFSHTYPAAGSYLVKLATIDGFDALTDLRTTIHVGVTPPAGGSVPFAVPKVSRPPQTSPYDVTFDGSQSFDLEGPIVAYEWNFGDFGNFLNTSTKPLVTYSYKHPGTYFAYLKVTDAGGNSTFRYFPVFIDSATPQDPEILLYPTATPREFSVEGNAYALKSVFEAQYLIWDFGDGSGEVRDPYAFHTYAADGTYTVTLKIYDQLGDYKEIQKSVVVTSTVTAPNAQFYPVSSTTNTNASLSFVTVNPGSVDPDTTAIWDFGDGTVISGLHEDNLNVSHTYLVKGVYLVTLMTTNVNGVSSRYQMSVYVKDASTIVANMQISPKIGNAPLPVRLDASGSTSATGSITDYIWAIYTPQGEQRIHGKTAAHSFETGGGYRDIVLYVKDASGNETMAFDRVLVQDPANPMPGNGAPVPQITISFPNSADPEWFGFDAVGSSDPESDQLIHYEWFLDGKKVIGNDPLVYYRILENGKHRITLRVTDVFGTVGEATKYFEKTTHTNVTMDFLFGPLTPVTDETVYFVAENVVIPGKAIKEKIWDFGDGNRNCCQDNVTHVYTSPGTYTAKLIVKDYDGNTYEKTKSILVADPSAPSVIISAQDSKNLFSASSGSDLVLSRVPAEVKFDLNSSTSQGLISDAQWDFGDGNTGFGLNPVWTYEKPGTYNVQVTATNEHGLSDTASITVIVTSDECINADGVTGCLILNIGNTKILPLSTSGWQLTHDQGDFDFVTAPTDPSWVTLERIEFVTGDDELDPSSRTTNIGDTVSVSGENLTINKILLLAKSLDLTKSYKLTVASNLTDGTDETSYWAQNQQVFFGLGTLNITTNEAGIRFLIQGSKSGYRKYVTLTTATSYSLGDLPADSYTISSEKGARSHTYEVDITSSTPGSLYIDLSPTNLKKMDEQWQREINNRKPLDPIVKASMFKNTQVASKEDIENFQEKMNYKTSGMPDWAYDGCGNAPPFRLTPPRVTPEGKEFVRGFSSSSPNAQNEYFSITPDLGEKLKLSCNLFVGQGAYQNHKWKYVLGRDRCWNGTPPRPPIGSYWEYYLSHITTHDRSFEVRYDLQDGVTGKVVSNTFDYSAARKRKEWGVNLDSISSKMGINIENSDWGYRTDKEIAIPKGMQRPKIKFSLKSQHITSPIEAMYIVTCDLERRTDIEKAAIESILPDDRVSSIVVDGHGAKQNGIKLKDNELLPISADTSLTSPINHSFPDIFKASFKLKLDKGDFRFADIVKVKAQFDYGTQQVVKIYDLEDKEEVSPDSKKFFGYIEMNILTDFGSSFSYQPLVNSISVKFWPQTDTGVLGAESVQLFTPMVNVKTVPSLNNPCNGGFYSGQISAYAVPEMIEAMNQSRVIDGLNFRCNDFSIPWGGIFSLTSSWKHEGHTKGRTVDVRYANFNEDTQDYYDWGPIGIPAYGRVRDVETYMRFSDNAKKVAEDTSLSVDKSKIYNYCLGHPVEQPCPTISSVGQINHKFVVQFCLWRQNTAWIDGCPVLNIVDDYLEAAQRYSIWATMNIDRNKKMMADFSYIMSEGKHREILTPAGTVGINWQKSALEKGWWPDGFPIYKVNAGMILEDALLCSDCDSGMKTDTLGGHYHHTHYQLR